MRTTFSLVFLLVFVSFSFSQEIKKVSAYENNYNSNSGIFSITDNCVYEYSWYYEAWLSLPVNGFTVVAGETKIDDISTFDNNSLNPSGIYVISDTAVFVYNYYAETWFPLSNEGLCRIGGKVQISELSAHLEIESDYVRVYVVSCGTVYYYSWYYQTWTALSNDGILTAKNDVVLTKVETIIYPNPLTTSSVISFQLPQDYSGDISIAIFDESGRFIKELFESYSSGGTKKIEINGEGFSPGLYYYEIKGDNYSKAKSFVKI